MFARTGRCEGSPAELDRWMARAQEQAYHASRVYQWLIFLHVAAVLLFMLAHGVQVTVMWKMRWEPDPDRNVALLEALPGLPLVRLLGVAVIATGFLLVAALSLWGRSWVWISLFLLGVIWLLMWKFGAGYFNLTHQAATWAIEMRGTAEEPGATAAFTKARLAWHPIGMTSMGLVGLAVILWLMIFKPF